VSALISYLCRHIINMRYLLLLFFLPILATSPAFCQQADSLRIRYTLLGDAGSIPAEASELDSNLNSLLERQKVLFDAPLLSGRSNNKGSAVYNLWYQPVQGSLIPVINPAYRNYILLSNNLPLLSTNTPFTEAYYAMGSGREQQFSITHAQNLGIFDAGVTYRILNSNGAYLNQKAKHDQWALFIKSSPQLKRLDASIVIAGNKLVNQENGGIQLAAEFEDSNYVNRQLIDVNLADASNSMIVNDMRLSVSYGVLMRDSLKRLSLVYDAGRIHSSRLYQDAYASAGFYPQIIGDSIKAHDSVAYTRWVQFFGFDTWMGHNRNLTLRVGLMHQNLNSNIHDSTFVENDFGLKAELHWKHGSHLAEAGADWFASGNSSSSFNVKYRFSGMRRPQNRLELHLGLVQAPLLPELTYYNGNFVAWSWAARYFNQGFASLSASLGNFKLGVIYHSINGFIYLNEQSLPIRAPDPVSLYQAFFKYDLEGRTFGMQHDVRLQQSSSDSLLGLPGLISYHHFYFRFPMFKDALRAQAGMECRFVGPFKPYAYRPDLAMFHLQSSFETVPYPYLDAYFAIKIQHVRLFLRSEHVNSGLLGNVYYLLPDYPMGDRNFVFGVAWTFYD
jgi:hypothetical protein